MLFNFLHGVSVMSMSASNEMLHLQYREISAQTTEITNQYDRARTLLGRFVTWRIPETIL